MGGYLPLPQYEAPPCPPFQKTEKGTPTHPTIQGRGDYPPSLALEVEGIHRNLPTVTCFPDNPGKEKREGSPPLPVPGG